MYNMENKDRVKWHKASIEDFFKMYEAPNYDRSVVLEVSKKFVSHYMNNGFHNVYSNLLKAQQEIEKLKKTPDYKYKKIGSRVEGSLEKEVTQCANPNSPFKSS